MMTKTLLSTIGSLAGMNAISSIVTGTPSFPSPLGDLAPFLQFGVVGIVLAVWWFERQDRLKRQAAEDLRAAEMDKRYSQLQEQLIEAMERPKRCPYDEEGEEHLHVKQQVRGPRR
jgi:hypothetical protein